MASIRFTQELSGLELRKETSDIGLQRKLALLVKEAVEDIAEFAADRARDFVPERTGDLRRSIFSTKASRIATSTYEADFGARRRYADWVDQGTGIFGPKGTMITASRKQSMLIPVQDLNRVMAGPGQTHIAVKAVKGQRATKFLERAIDAAEVYEDKRIAQMIAEWDILREVSKR